MPTPKSKLSKFILSLPATLTGTEVVERAKANGMKTSGANVYRVRGLFGAKTSKTKATQPAAPPTVAPNTTSKTPAKSTKPRATPRKSVAVPRPIATASSAEDLLRALAAEIGLQRAAEILIGERARVLSILKG